MINDNDSWYRIPVRRITPSQDYLAVLSLTNTTGTRTADATSTGYRYNGTQVAARPIYNLQLEDIYNLQLEDNN